MYLLQFVYGGLVSLMQLPYFGHMMERNVD